MAYKRVDQNDFELGSGEVLGEVVVHDGMFDGRAGGE